jgi:uncharacterized protein (DUF1330 family)
MAAYVVVNVDVIDPVKFAEYGRGVPPTIEKYGGRYLVRGGAIHPVEGEWPLKRVVILEFPSIEDARRWHDSAEYAPLLKMRLESTRSTMVFVEGCAPPA